MKKKKEKIKRNRKQLLTTWKNTTFPVAAANSRPNYQAMGIIFGVRYE